MEKLWHMSWENKMENGKRLVLHAVIMALDAEISLLQLGEKKILMVPGEVFPELVYDDDTRFFPAKPEKNLESLTGLFGQDMPVFGLCDDEIGYIVSSDNFKLIREKTYLERTMDKPGEDHYGETNSLGPDTAVHIRKAAEKLKQSAAG